MKLIITRHGETIENINKIHQGHTHGTLSEKGIEQAKKLALRLKDEKIDFIYSSDLKRASDTAKEIIKYHPNLKLQLDERLRERYTGSMSGKPWPKDWDWTKLPEDFESDKEICIRAKKFLDELYAKHKDKNVLLVCHGGIKMALLTVIHDKPAEEFGEFEGIKNTAVSILEIEENKDLKIHCINCLKHLD